MGNTTSRFVPHRRALRIVVGGVFLVPTLLFGSADMSTAATPGTWGVGNYSYVDGTVCTNGNVTSPLAAWNFGDAADEYLTSTVTSNGVRDSAKLPTADVVDRFVTPVSPGQLGFNSAADISTYATLLTLFGGGQNPQAAVVARAVLDKTEPGTAPGCVGPSAAHTLVNQAARLAGPYTLAASVAANPVAVGTPNTVLVKVTNNAGQPVPGVRVTITSQEPVLGSGTTSTSATTNGAGTAHAAFTAPAGGAVTQVDFTATAEAAAGLEAVGVNTSALDPGPYAGAIFADPPTPYSTTLTLPVNQSAHPVLVNQLTNTGFAQGANVQLAAALTGMAGHTGNTTFTVLGPVSLDPRYLCTRLSKTAFTTASPVAATSQTPVVGDGLINGGVWHPTAAGCYRFQVQVATTDATPAASALSPATIMTVLDTQAAATTPHNVVGGGPITVTTAITKSHGIAGTLTTTLLGPASPGDGDCTAVDWTKVAHHPGPTVKTTGDGTYTVTSAALSATGCYLFPATVALPISSSGKAAIVASYASGAGIFYVLHPTVTAAATATAVVSPGAVSTSVTVQNSYGQPGHVSIQMLQAPPDQFGCRAGDFAHATVIASGLPTAVAGDGIFTVPSGKTPKLGCYALIPKLVMDGNAAVVATGVPTTDDIVSAGIANPVTQRLHLPPVVSSLTPVYVTFGIFLAILLATAVGVVRYAYVNRDEDSEEPFRDAWNFMIAPLRGRRRTS